MLERLAIGMALAAVGCTRTVFHGAAPLPHAEVKSETLYDFEALQRRRGAEYVPGPFLCQSGADA